MSASTPTGTGGFVFRAERTTAIDASAATSPKVGPGTYQTVASNASPPVPAAAPFHTSTERTQDVPFSPGPGTYDVALAATALMSGPTTSVNANSHTPGFVSQQPRIPTDKTHDYVPGPGSYAPSPKWGKKTHRYSAPESRQRLSFQRGATAPSIPANHQSYGYEEDPSTGSLIMQKPQEPVHSGVGLDRPGPGSYNPDTTPIAPRVGDKAPSWSHSRTERLGRYHTDVPGPGSYNPSAGPKGGTGLTVNINGVEVMFGGAGGTSSFASKAPRAHQRMPQDFEILPGPGAYIPLPNTQKSSQPHFFGSTGPRGFEIDPVRSLAAPTYFKVPGPGAYEDAARRSISAGPRIGTFVDTNPFNATAARFGNNENGIPGPGEYNIDTTASIKRDVHSRSYVGRSGVFGSVAPRFNNGAGGSQMAGGAAVAAALGWVNNATSPGPGSYDPPKPRKPASKYESSQFASHTGRFVAPTGPSHPDLGPRSADDFTPVRGDPCARGPGAYELSVPWTKKKISHKSTAFGSESKRGVAPPTTAAITPGPGRYKADVDINTSFRPVVHTAPDAVFGAASSRFKENPRYAPGPGQYDVDKSSVQKRSYNVTYTPA